MSLWIASAVAVFAWWFATGAILAVVARADRGGRRSHLWAVLLALPVLVLGAALFVDTLGRTQSGAVYAAFFAALMIWGWIEMAFLCGIVTGPNRGPTPASAGAAERFRRAWGAVAHHELALLVALLAMVWASVATGAENPAAVLTFAVLYGARITAKLNLFFGVPRINVDFLPRALSHLPTHFRVRRATWFHPVSMAALAAALALCLTRIDGAPPHLALAWTFTAAMTALALLEHLLMVLPLPDEKLWRWMLPEPRQHPPHRPSEPAE